LSCHHLKLQLIVYFRGSVLLAGLKSKALRAVSEPKFVHKREFPKGNEPHKRIRRHDVQTLLERVLDCLELLLGYASINHKDKDIGRGLDVLADVLDCRVVLEEFDGEVCVGDVRGIRRWEPVPVLAEGTHPVLPHIVHRAEGVEDRLAFALQWVVFDECHVLEILLGAVEATHGDDSAGEHLLAGYELVPGESDSVLRFFFVEIHFILSAELDIVYKFTSRAGDEAQIVELQREGSPCPALPCLALKGSQPDC